MGFSKIFDSQKGAKSPHKNRTICELQRELYDLCVKEGLFVPPNNMESWAQISDQHSPRFSVGQIPEDMLWREIMKNKRANQWKGIKFFLKETSPRLMITLNFLHRGLVTLRKIVVDQLTTLCD